MVQRSDRSKASREVPREVRSLPLHRTTTTFIGPAPTTVLGIQQAAQKGIAARAVLLDFAGWAETQNISYSAFTVSLPSPLLLPQFTIFRDSSLTRPTSTP